MEARLSRRQFLKEAAAWVGTATGLSFLGCRTTIIPDTKPESTAVPAQPILPTKTEPATDIIKDGSNTFIFGDEVTKDQKDEIGHAVTEASKWFSSQGIIIDDISIFTFNDPKLVVDKFLERSSIPPTEHASIRQNLSQATAFSGMNRDFYIIASSPGWTSASPIIGGPAREGRYHTVAHELFHVWQRMIGAYNQEPVAWLNEGIPHYIAAAFLRDIGMYDYEKIRKGHLSEVIKVPQLISSLEVNSMFYRAGNPATADEYSLAFLAVEFLTKDLPNSGVKEVADFWKKIGEGISWQSAFNESFGKTTIQFYNEFETYRKQGFTN